MLYFLLALGVCALLVLFFRRRLLARLLRLPPPQYSVGVERAIPLIMADGVKLLTDHYWPKAKGDFPTVLIRTPYGRGHEVFLFGGFPMGELPAQRFAERGYHVIVQGVRGCYESEGEFEPHINEAADGRATANWIQEQSWFDGRLAVWGPSYLGYTAWATATTVPNALKAMVAVITSAENHGATHPDGAFALETRLRWCQGLANAKKVHEQALPGKLRSRFFSGAEEALQSAFQHLPLESADEVATGGSVPFYRDMLAYASDRDPYWTARDHSQAVAQVEAPVHLIGGWYDYYLPGLLRDYATMRDAGRNPSLTIGPWNHANAEVLLTGLSEGLKWFDAQLKGQNGARRRQPVHIYLMGAQVWKSMEVFPPPSRPTNYYLNNDGLLGIDEPVEQSAPSTFTYDPADPTPAMGGALLALKGAGAVDNRSLESRPDVLCFTTSALREPIEFIGIPQVTLYVRSSRPFTDFHSRLCDVFPDDRSINICDGLVRIRPDDGQRQDDGTLRVTIELKATAYRVLAGHRLRLQVSSGAHPRWNRNLGLGEEELTATTMIAAQQQVYHDREHPSALRLPRVAE